jgi:hypothetical protein
MDQEKGMKLVGNGPHRFERRVVKVSSVHVRADLCPAQSKRRHRTLELVGGARRVLQRQRRQTHEAAGVTVDDPRDLIVLQRRAGATERGLLVVEEGVNGGGDELRGDAVLIHVAQPEIEIVDLRRHRPLHHLAGDLHDGDPVVMGQLRRDAQRFLAQEPDGLLGQHMGMHVDGDRRAHLTSTIVSQSNDRRPPR